MFPTNAAHRGDLYGYQAHMRQDPYLYGSDDDESSFNEISTMGTSVATDETCITFIRKSCGAIVTDYRSQIVITSIILMNSLTMGLATYPIVRENDKVREAFEIIDLIFLIFYTFELALHFVYLGFYMFRDPWLVFDFFVVAMSWFSDIVQGLRSFRVMRATRIFRAFRLIGRVRSIREVVLAIYAVSPNLVLITLLLTLVFYIFAVLFTSTFGDMYDLGQTEVNYFTHMGLSAFTLFQIMCLDDWSQIAREIMYYKTWAWLSFIAFIICTSFTMLNMIIAVLCQSIHIIGDEYEKTLAKQEEEVPIEIELEEIVENLQYISKQQEQVIRVVNDLSFQMQREKIRKRFPQKKSTCF